MDPRCYQPRILACIQALREFSACFVFINKNNYQQPSEAVKRLILCSGKVFYDLIEKKKEENREDIAVVRIEQLYPFPYDDLEEILTKYQNVQEFIWCQEEPLNQGAWFSHRHRIQRVLDRLGDGLEVSLVSRPAAAAPAVGLMKLHLQQQKDLVNEAICK